MILLVLAFSSEEEKSKFEYIYEKYKNLLLHKAYGILHDYMLAEDAASEAFLRIYKNLGKIDDPDSGRCIAFIVTIVKNVSLTLLQKKAKNTAEELPEQQQDEFRLEDFVVSELSSGEIYNLLEQVGEEYKNAFLLKYAYDMSNQEIGKTMGVSANHVGVLLHRAKKKLKAILQEGGYAHEQA
ncbi:sigma-70 family RNA polymerase sigma factor [Christensenellaceae bacterium OttesenSCG-928-K19]|nr:sigma-70 family RNA polymerase sigma factor [Christensenellaceae bacterium OttesenSCG-928-K19]